MRKTMSRQRMRIAEEAARLIVESGISDYPVAKKKACERLGYSRRIDLPMYEEIEALVRQRQRLFSSVDQQQILDRLRQVALSVMQFFSGFDPRLVGDALRGSATPHSILQLHLFSDDAEPVAIQLINAGLPFRAIEQPDARKHKNRIPGFSFYWDQTEVETWIYPASGLRVSPPDLIDGKPMRRASVAEVRDL